MNLNIGPYKISQRTSYSKLCISDIYTGKNISEYDENFINDVIKAYIEQNLHPEKFYEINNDILIKVKPNISVDIKYLIVPDGITKIEKQAFCRSDVNFVGLPDTLKTIGHNAFLNCESLEYISIPDTVEEMGAGVFGGCYNLVEAKLPNKLDMIQEFSFLNCSKLRDVYMPDTVTDINRSAFAHCESLENIKLSKNLKKIETRAFARCINLLQINLPEGLEIMEEQAFSECYSLEEIVIPDSIKMLDGNIFNKCSGLETTKLPKNLDILNNNMFLGCESLENIILPDNISTFGYGLFAGTEKLNNINIPQNLKIIIKPPFHGSSIEAITFNHNLKKLSFIEDNVDYDLITKSKITKIIIDKSVETITSNAFRFSGSQITAIDYLGTKKQFEKFKENNKELFEKLPNISEIKFDSKQLNEKNNKEFER